MMNTNRSDEKLRLGLRENRAQFSLRVLVNAYVGGMGLGTAMVYSTLLAAIAAVAPPSWRASAMGVYRLWRDLGYAIGALVTGALADRYGITEAMGGVALLSLCSGIAFAFRSKETLVRPLRGGLS